MKQAIAMALLIAWAAPVPAAEAAVTGKVGLLLPPPGIGHPSVGPGISVELTDRSRSLATHLEGERNWTGRTMVWSTWLAWRLTNEVNASSWSILAGYNQSISMFPRLGGAGNPTPSDWDPPSLLVGVSYQWANGPFTLRLSPHLAAGVWHQTVDVFYSTMRSTLAGPPLLEISWQALDHVELGLRLSFIPLRASWTF
jgi:hypothetical protein